MDNKIFITDHVIRHATDQTARREQARCTHIRIRVDSKSKRNEKKTG